MGIRSAHRASADLIAGAPMPGYSACALIPSAPFAARSEGRASQGREDTQHSTGADPQSPLRLLVGEEFAPYESGECFREVLF
jgi:hypothetical protein